MAASGSPRPFKDKIILLVAEGFGSGRAPFAPGTFGSLVGLLWTWLLLIPQSPALFVTGIVVGFFVSVWIGGRAEHILQKTDPGSIVIDEITAIPLASLGILVEWKAASFGDYFEMTPLLLFAAAYVLFRIADIVKPFGIKRIQHLPGGWGLTVDDFLAALLVMPIVWVLARLAA